MITHSPNSEHSERNIVVVDNSYHVKHKTAEKVYQLLFTAAKGDYHRNLLSGYVRPSGSDLKGKAKTWSNSYSKSRQSLLKGIAAVLPKGWHFGPVGIRRAGQDFKMYAFWMDKRKSLYVISCV